ncbi:hypothetical protein [Bdellovibrio sp. GT3]|uniref:hypothetical protein n=1 Tax=Bdellovibrio sp. GT3 TaxID=3136282 RepID=UPI0030EFC36F
MDEADFEGTEVLEQIAAIGKLDDFFEALDSDDFGRAVSLMKKARIDSETIQIVVRKMKEAGGKH